MIYIISNRKVTFLERVRLVEDTALKAAGGKSFAGSIPVLSAVRYYFMSEQFYKEFYERIQHSIQISIKHGHNEYALGLKKSVMIVNELKHKYHPETK